MQKKRIWLYAGTWTTSGEGGIGIYRYAEETGETKYIKTVREDVVAGLTVADREKGILYTLDERANNPDIGEKAGGGGRVFAFRIDPETGDLTEINHQSSLGVMPAYLSWDSGKPEKGGSRGLITCNHSSGESVTKVVRDMTGRISLERQFSDTTVVHYPLRPDGSIGEPDDVVVTPPERGIYSCLHSANLAPDGRSIILCDRNLDRVHLLHWEKEQKKLVMDATVLLPQGMSMKTGATPRYSAFHPFLPLVYVNCEYSPYIYILRYGGNGFLEMAGRADIAPPGKEAGSYSPSDLCLSPDGRFLYMLYRWTDQVGIFSVDPENGSLAPAGWLALSGKEPRGMCFSPDGRFLLVAAMKSGDITTLKVREDGTLEELGRTSGQYRPGNINFYYA